MAGIVIVSVVAGTAAVSGSVAASDEAHDVTVLNDGQVAGTGTLTVRTDLSVGADKAAFKVQDADGTSSRAVTVHDDGAADQSSMDGVIVADLDLDAMFDSKPASGTAILAVDQGADPFSFEYQTYDTKQEVTLDADAPTVAVLGDETTSRDTVRTTNERQVKLGYTATDVPQKLASARLEIVGPDGAVVKTFDDLQSGTLRTVQFTVPKYWDSGAYDLRLVAVDEVGHRSSDSFEDGLVIEPSGTQVSSKNVRVIEEQPVRGDETVALKIGTEYPGADAAIRVQDANGTVSERVVVTDGGERDQVSDPGIIVTTVDLDAVFESSPASGTAMVGVDHDADPFSFEYQTYDVKRQLEIDADAPTVAITGASPDARTRVSGAPGSEVKVYYTIHDNPPKIQSGELRIVDDGETRRVIDGLQAGTNRKAQFTIPDQWAAGNYTIEVTATDEVGHTTTATYEDGLVVNATSSA